MGKKREVDERFKKFGTVAFTGISKVNDFIDHLQGGKVMGTRCNECGLTFFPPRADCHSCLSSDTEWFEVTGKGKLISFSQLAFAPIGFKEDLPYCIAALDYGDFKVFGRIADGIDPAELHAGLEMTTAANKLANGQLNYVFHKA